MTELDKQLELMVAEGKKRFNNASDNAVQKVADQANTKFDKELSSFDVGTFKPTETTKVAGDLVGKVDVGNDPTSNALQDGLSAGLATGNPYIAGVAAIGGGLSAAQKEKERVAGVEAKALRDKAKNEQNTQLRRSSAIQGLAANLSRSLLR